MSIHTKAINKNENPLFSILIPTRDRPTLAKDLICSILDQSFKDFEIIVADNSSNQDTQNFLNTISDIRLINLQTGGLKMADNWEAGIEQCSGSYLLIFSDKMLLKSGSLDYLASYIKRYSPSCVNWDIESFFENELTYFPCQQSLDEFSISAESVLREILTSEFDSVRIPCHCNSAISMSIIKLIKSESGRACFQLNPDYTLAYQVLLKVNEIHNLDKALSILRYPSFKSGHGNGTSFMLKGEQAKNFMLDNADWIERTNKYTAVRMPSNHFGLDLILKDLYYVLEKYEIDPDDFLPQDQRYINYYIFTYLEIIFRMNMGTNMQNELKLWRASLNDEALRIKSAVSKKIRKHHLRFFYIRFKSLLLNIEILARFIHFIGDFLFRNNAKKFKSLDDCLSKTKLL